MKRIVIALVGLALAQAAIAEAPLPTIKIVCNVKYDFVNEYAKERGASSGFWDQGGRNFSWERLFITREGIAVYPEFQKLSKRYKVSLTKEQSQFIRHACTEDVGEVLAYISNHDFDAHINRFYWGTQIQKENSKNMTRKVGGWTLISEKYEPSQFRY